MSLEPRPVSKGWCENFERIFFPANALLGANDDSLARDHLILREYNVLISHVHKSVGTDHKEGVVMREDVHGKTRR
jgi:hypothetical protein